MKFSIEMNEFPDSVQLQIIRHTSNEDLLIFYSKSSDPLKRAVVASNPKTPTATLDELVFDKSNDVLMKLIVNPSLLEVSLDRLADITDDEEILIGIARHKNTSKERLLSLYKKSTSLNLTAIVGKRLERMKNS